MALLDEEQVRAVRLGAALASCSPLCARTASIPHSPLAQVLAKLSETAEKSLLGGLKGAAGSWDKVVKAYEYNRECH